MDVSRRMVDGKGDVEIELKAVLLRVQRTLLLLPVVVKCANRAAEDRSPVEVFL